MKNAMDFNQIIMERHGSNASLMLSRLGGNSMEIVEKYFDSISKTNNIPLFSDLSIENDADICFDIISAELKKLWVEKLSKEQVTTLCDLLMMSYPYNDGYQICHDVTISAEELKIMWNDLHEESV